jgi:hypothetical protein
MNLPARVIDPMQHIKPAIREFIGYNPFKIT